MHGMGLGTCGVLLTTAKPRAYSVVAASVAVAAAAAAAAGAAATVAAPRH